MTPPLVSVSVPVVTILSPTSSVSSIVVPEVKVIAPLPVVTLATVSAALRGIGNVFAPVAVAVIAPVFTFSVVVSPIPPVVAFRLNVPVVVILSPTSSVSLILVP